MVEFPREFISDNMSISLLDRGLTKFVQDEVFS